jgi:hypothetical protein
VEGRHGVTKIGVKWRWARWLAYPDEGAAARCGERCRYNFFIGAELSAYKVMGGGARQCGASSSYDNWLGLNGIERLGKRLGLWHARQGGQQSMT